MKNGKHPYHYSSESPIQRLIDFGVPIGLFYLYFQFYNFGQITPSEMVKTTGLLAIALLSLTLFIGPLCRFIPQLDSLKAHRKVWGILAFLSALTHTILIIIFYFKFDFSRFVDFTNPRYLGILTGLLALSILLVVTVTSSKLALTALKPKVWKMIQTTAYLALVLAFAHFYLVESKDGVLVIKRLLGQITYYFAGFVVLFRLLVTILPNKK